MKLKLKCLCVYSYNIAMLSLHLQSIERAKITARENDGMVDAWEYGYIQVKSEIN